MFVVMRYLFIFLSALPVAGAQEGARPPPPGGGWDFLIFMLVLFAILYFLMIRPQMKRARQHREMVAALRAGDEVVTNGGLLGRVRNVGDSFLLLELAHGTEVKVQKHAVANIVPKGTFKTL